MIGRTLVFAIVATSLTSWVLPDVVAHAEPPAANAPAAAEQAAPAKPAGGEAVRPAPAAPSPVLPKVSRADCESNARALKSGDKAAAAKQPGAAGPATRTANADLVTCAAVLADSDEPCARLDGESADNCRRDRAAFHEMRAYPNGSSFMLDDRKYEECKQNTAMAPVCESIRKALRSGDVSQCVLNADFDAICRSAGDLDVAKCATEGPQLKKLLEGQCRAMVTLDESACDVPGPRHAEMAKQCRDDIKANKAYGKGLKQLAKSGAPREKELAKAALKEADACKTFTQSAVDACLEASTAESAPHAEAQGDGKSVPPPPNPEAR